MASNVQTDRPSEVSSARRAALVAYRWLLLGFLLLGAVQIFLAGLGAFRLDNTGVSGDTAFAPHRAVGFAMGGVALVILILALIARPALAPLSSRPSCSCWCSWPRACWPAWPTMPSPSAACMPWTGWPSWPSPRSCI